jgi:hypothetical protein
MMFRESCAQEHSKHCAGENAREHEQRDFKGRHGESSWLKGDASSHRVTRRTSEKSRQPDVSSTCMMTGGALSGHPAHRGPAAPGANLDTVPALAVEVEATT